jgi:hypothetical protein
LADNRNGYNNQKSKHNQWQDIPDRLFPQQLNAAQYDLGFTILKIFQTFFAANKFCSIHPPATQKHFALNYILEHAKSQEIFCLFNQYFTNILPYFIQTIFIGRKNNHPKRTQCP